MRIHTDTLTEREIRAAAARFNLYPEVLTKHGSRKRDHAFEVQLSGSSSRKAQSGEWNAATWDEWGAFIGYLFSLDSEATMSYYESAEAFHRYTCNRFQSGMLPADTHNQHRWVYDFSNSRPFSGIKVMHCNSCSAAITH